MTRTTTTRRTAAATRIHKEPWLADLSILRHVLVGESAVDLPRLWFRDRDAVDAFLRLQQFDTDNPMDIGRLQDLLHEAVEYLRETFRYRAPQEVEQPKEIHDLFLLAAHGRRELRGFACMALKVMHILHHLGGQELVFRASVSEAQLVDRLSGRVFTMIDGLRAAGIEVLEFAGGKKSRQSVVTKLLSKRETQASQIFDRLRFGITVRDRDDVVRAVLFLMHHLVPFNYVVPGQSQNGIITLGDIARVLEIDPEKVWEEWTRDREQVIADGSAPTPPNEFSGRTYRCVNFVADIPLRIDDAIPSAAPAIAFAKTEIQLVDETTKHANNQGENAHPRYKKRQHSRVRDRLRGRSRSVEAETH